MLFHDRHDAGRQLALALATFRQQHALVLGLPRGGVIVAYEVARFLSVPLDVFITRKIGAPGNPEYAIGAIAEKGEAQLNWHDIWALGIPADYVEKAIAQQRAGIERQTELYRGRRPLSPIENRRVILVDDGIATGFTMRASIRAVRAQQPQELIVAVPVAPRASVEELGREVDNIFCLATPEPFLAVGRFYRDFSQVTDEEVKECLPPRQE